MFQAERGSGLTSFEEKVGYQDCCGIPEKLAIGVLNGHSPGVDGFSNCDRQGSSFLMRVQIRNGLEVHVGLLVGGESELDEGCVLRGQLDAAVCRDLG